MQYDKVCGKWKLIQKVETKNWAWLAEAKYVFIQGDIELIPVVHVFAFEAPQPILRRNEQQRLDLRILRYMPPIGVNQNFDMVVWMDATRERVLHELHLRNALAWSSLDVIGQF